MATVARQICQSVDLVGLQAFTSCSLVALDKHPGALPDGIGEVLWRISGKAILAITGTDVQHATGALQVCALASRLAVRLPSTP